MRWGEEYNVLANCLGTCILEQDTLTFSLGLDHYGELYRSVTGLPLSVERITTLTDRIMDMQQVVSAGAGFVAAHDTWRSHPTMNPLATVHNKARWWIGDL